MYVGIDGGGTATRGILSNGHDVMLEAGAGPSNAIVVGEERAYEAVQKTWRALVEHPGTLIDATVIGLAGVDRPFLRDNWIRRLDQLIPGDYWLVGDYQLAWAALSHGDPGVVGILGTGSVFFWPQWRQRCTGRRLWMAVGRLGIRYCFGTKGGQSDLGNAGRYRRDHRFRGSGVGILSGVHCT
ncbi:MAG: BadF/BadG/BcrA/BcrD ATPase family protein [Sulfobacillus sp.]